MYRRKDETFWRRTSPHDVGEFLQDGVAVGSLRVSLAVVWPPVARNVLRVELQVGPVRNNEDTHALRLIGIGTYQLWAGCISSTPRWNVKRLDPCEVLDVCRVVGVVGSDDVPRILGQSLEISDPLLKSLRALFAQVLAAPIDVLIVPAELQPSRRIDDNGPAERNVQFAIGHGMAAYEEVHAIQIEAVRIGLEELLPQQAWARIQSIATLVVETKDLDLFFCLSRNKGHHPTWCGDACNSHNRSSLPPTPRCPRTKGCCNQWAQHGSLRTTPCTGLASAAPRAAARERARGPRGPYWRTRGGRSGRSLLESRTIAPSSPPKARPRSSPLGRRTTSRRHCQVASGKRNRPVATR
mmetsp:Transcript_45346/g.145423  ORF Transcript_45346/g.145423 Transcript_45346/m.145423 type:complete len:354 (+) Transcript_45346:796-1857(+)